MFVATENLGWKLDEKRRNKFTNVCLRIRARQGVSLRRVGWLVNCKKYAGQVGCFVRVSCWRVSMADGSVWVEAKAREGDRLDVQNAWRRCVHWHPDPFYELCLTRQLRRPQEIPPKNSKALQVFKTSHGFNIAWAWVIEERNRQPNGIRGGLT
jgi:hypothetical protein